MNRHAAVTIVSKNYLAFARTLAESYLRHHPDHDFLIALVDKADGFVPERLACGAEVIEIAAFRMPDLPRMIYRYSIMELNTAVKPFVMRDLFERRGYETLLYIDPDIEVFAPLDEVRSALDRASVVLIPHTRRPFFDDRMPSDTAILQSGTYNLGFLGLRRGETSRRLLDWWSTKLHRDCVVDIPNGLFVDQKWMDLVPGFFPDHAIVHHPGYNAAYWNLHERQIDHDGTRWLADGKPLVFFHYSGYLPRSPERLSKHQNRHKLQDLPALLRLTDAYAATLIANDYDVSSRWKYAFETLPNGVSLPLSLVATALRTAEGRQLDVPCPLSEPDRFCRFLMTRGLLAERPEAVLLFDALLAMRPDVANAFPASRDDHDNPGFRAWIRTSGVHEYKLADLLPFEERPLSIDPVQTLFSHLRSQGSGSPLALFGGMWREPAQVQQFIAWLESADARRHGIQPGHVQAFRAALGGISRSLHLYFLREDLQREFPDLQDGGQREDYVRWLRRHAGEIDFSQAEITVFAEFARSNGTLLEAMRVLYFHRGAVGRSEPDLFDIGSRLEAIGSTAPHAAIVQLLVDDPAIDVADNALAHFGGEATIPENPALLAPASLEPAARGAFEQRLRDALRARRRAPRPVNVAGYFEAVTGMGESGRSLRVLLQAAGIADRPFTLATPRSIGAPIPASPAVFGWPAANAALSITVANADAIPVVERILPPSFRARRNIAYWVWETEKLPAHLARAQRGFDEIWTPSAYSAEAIGRVVDCPVQVLPHTIDFDAIAAARGDRARFGLPQGTLYGFAFDPHSGIERKNVRGLVQAFQAAIRPDDDAYLILKVNAIGRSGYEFEKMRAEITCDRVLFLEGQLDRVATFDFLKTLDVYVSLHRAEGFGLTCAEAMACGVPVVATGYSGNLDFMTESDSVLVPATVVETDRPWGAYPAGTRWAEPDRRAAEAALRRLLDPQARAHLGSVGAHAVRARLAPEALAPRLRALLSPVLEATSTH